MDGILKFRKRRRAEAEMDGKDVKSILHKSLNSH